MTTTTKTTKRAASRTRKTIKTTEEPAVAWARAKSLVDRMRTGFKDAQDAAIEFIKVEGWKTLGYENFEKFWIDQMADILIAIELRPHVVYQMLSEGLTPKDAAELAGSSGVTEDYATALKEERDSGVPPEAASRRTRATRSELVTIFLPGIRRQERDEWKQIAATDNLRLEEVAVAAVRDAFDQMAKQQKKTRSRRR